MRRPACFLFALGLSLPVHAGGIMSHDNVGEGFGRGGAYVAKADDGTAMAYNPAGLSHTQNWELVLGTSLVSFDQSFARTGVYPETNLDPPQSYIGQPYPEVENAGGPQPVPFVAANFRVHPKWVIGAALIAPHGYPGRDMPLRINDLPGPQRYDVISQEAIVVFPTLGLATELFEGFRVGAALAWGVGFVKAEVAAWGLPNQAEDVRRDVGFQVDTKDKFVPAARLGFLYRINSHLEIGLAYSSPVVVNNKGDATAQLGEGIAFPFGMNASEVTLRPAEAPRCADGGTAEVFKSCVTFRLPQIAQLGARWRFTNGAGQETGDIEIDVRWEDWSNASDIEVIVDATDSLGGELQEVIIPHGFRDVWSARLGGSYSLASLTGVDLGLRAGASYDTAAAPNNWIRADVDGTERLTVSAGAGMSLGPARFELGAAFVVPKTTTVTDTVIADESDPSQHVQPNPIYPLVEADEQVYGPFNAGRYERSYWMVGLTGSLRY